MILQNQSSQNRDLGDGSIFQTVNSYKITNTYQFEFMKTSSPHKKFLNTNHYETNSFIDHELEAPNNNNEIQIFL